MSCGAGRRCGLDATLLWLWHRQGAIALIQPLAWELPYAASAALKKEKKSAWYAGVQHMIITPNIDLQVPF